MQPQQQQEKPQETAAELNIARIASLEQANKRLLEEIRLMKEKPFCQLFDELSKRR